MNAAKLLVVDDSKSVLYAIKTLLASSNLQIDTARDGLEGHDAINKTRYDMVITDVDMPRLDGLALCKWIKSNPDSAKIPVIILSSRETDQDIENGFNAGADAYVPKAQASTDLIPQIERVMRRCNFVESKTVLVVEDSQSIRELTRTGLEEAGFKVLLAHDGLHALELLETNQPDLVLTDLSMPNMSGQELCHKLFHSERFKLLPVVVMSSMSDRPVIQRLMHDGVSAFIAKPFTVDTLVLNLEKILSEHFQRIMEERERLAVEQRLILGSISSLINALEARDKYTHGHSDSVTRLASGIGRELGFGSYEMTRLTLAGNLHDLGKIGVRDNVLLKPGKLTEDEFEHIKIHTIIVKDILAPQANMDDVIEAASSHHERWDGKGYPNGLKGEEIPLLARIIAVADVFDALTSERPYRSGMSREEALQFIDEGRGTHFCPEIVDAFFRFMQTADADS